VPEGTPIGAAAALVDTEIKEVSREVGEGVFALKEFKKGEVICGTILNYILYYTILYYTILYYTILYYTMLY